MSIYCLDGEISDDDLAAWHAGPLHVRLELTCAQVRGEQGRAGARSRAGMGSAVLAPRAAQLATKDNQEVADMIDDRAIRTEGQRLGGVSWGVWADRAVVRALEIDPGLRIQGALLDGEAISHVALMIARSIGYLGRTQRAPELPGEVRTWLDGACPAGLSWAAWAERAAKVAMAIEEGRCVEGALMKGQPLWKVALTIARSVAFLAGSRRAFELPKEVRTFLLGSPGLLTASLEEACQ